jgi:hypothetical protein
MKLAIYTTQIASNADLKTLRSSISCGSKYNPVVIATKRLIFSRDIWWLKTEGILQTFFYAQPAEPSRRLGTARILAFVLRVRRLCSLLARPDETIVPVLVVERKILILCLNLVRPGIGCLLSNTIVPSVGPFTGVDSLKNRMTRICTDIPRLNPYGRKRNQSSSLMTKSRPAMKRIASIAGATVNTERCSMPGSYSPLN